MLLINFLNGCKLVFFCLYFNLNEVLIITFPRRQVETQTTIKYEILYFSPRSTP